jgi:anaerobic magnesium-protoporphyrin IX monomethyl ester cyclase
LPPLGLLSIGGPLIDDGHDVTAATAEFGPDASGEIVARAVAHAPEAFCSVIPGSTSGHPVIAEVASPDRRPLPGVKNRLWRGVPTYHWREILRDEPYVTAIVRGEGEETARRLMHALETEAPCWRVRGIAYREMAGARARRRPPAGSAISTPIGSAGS